MRHILKRLVVVDHVMVDGLAELAALHRRFGLGCGFLSFDGVVLVDRILCHGVSFRV